MSVEFSLLELASVRINETPCDSFYHAVVYAQAVDELAIDVYDRDLRIQTLSTLARIKEHLR